MGKNTTVSSQALPREIAAPLIIARRWAAVAAKAKGFVHGAMTDHLGGETLIEANWKSVRMPGQGVCVGEPLARPFGGLRSRREGRDLIVRTRLLRPGRYALLASAGQIGPFRRVAEWAVPTYGTQEIRLSAAAGSSCRVVGLAGGSR